MTRDGSRQLDGDWTAGRPQRRRRSTVCIRRSPRSPGPIAQSADYDREHGGGRGDHQRDDPTAGFRAGIILIAGTSR